MKKIMVIFSILTDASVVFAADSSASTLWGLFRMGGIWMWFLLALSVLSIGFIMEKFYAFHIARLRTKHFLPEFERVARSRNTSAVKALIAEKKYLVAKVLQKAFTAEVSLEEFERIVERTSSIAVNELSKGLNILATIGSMAPLIGFLGTVAGMITAFGNIAAADDVSAQLVAGGIYTALTTTAYGLIVSIPSIAMYNYFVNRIDNFVADVEKTVNMLIENGIVK